MMNLMLAAEAGFSALFKPYNKLYSWSGELNYPRDASKQISDFENALYTNFPDAHYSTLDGISMFYPDWKLNIRFSNTEPLVRISIETIGENKISEKQKLIQDLFQLPEITASSH
jgi:phosphomannomutase